MVTMTAQTQRELEKQAYDVFMANCPTRQVMATIGGKWSALVVVALAERPHRFSELRRHIAGVSQKMLTQTLRELERDGLLTRRAEATVPVTVEYALTERGRTLVDPLKTLKAWAEGHIEGILASRAAFDAAA